MPLVSLVALVLAFIAHRRKHVYAVKPMVLFGVGAISTIIVVSIVALVTFDGVIESYGYTHCPALDQFQGVSRHGVPNIISTAWTLKGQCH